MHLLHSQASQCRSYNGVDNIFRHAAASQWMYDYHRRWEAHDLCLAEAHEALELGEEPQSQDAFFDRFRYRLEAVNHTPPSPYFLPTAIVAEQYDPTRPFFGQLILVDSMERCQSTIVEVYRQAIRDKCMVTWQTFASRPRECYFPSRYDILYERHHGWWINPIHLAMLGGGGGGHSPTVA